MVELNKDEYKKFIELSHFAIEVIGGHNLNREIEYKIAGHLLGFTSGRSYYQQILVPERKRISRNGIDKFLIRSQKLLFRKKAKLHPEIGYFKSLVKDLHDAFESKLTPKIDDVNEQKVLSKQKTLNTLCVAEENFDTGIIDEKENHLAQVKSEFRKLIRQGEDPEKLNRVRYILLQLQDSCWNSYETNRDTICKTKFFFKRFNGNFLDVELETIEAISAVTLTQTISSSWSGIANCRTNNDEIVIEFGTWRFLEDGTKIILLKYVMQIGKDGRIMDSSLGQRFDYDWDTQIETIKQVVFERNLEHAQNNKKTTLFWK